MVVERRQDGVGSALPSGGAAWRVPLSAPLAYYVTYPAGTIAPAVMLTLRYEGPLRAPLGRGAQVAALRVSAPGQIPQDLPLLTASHVTPAGPLARLRNGLFGLAGL